MIKIAILAEKGVQDEEYLYPSTRLLEEGWVVDTYSLNGGQIYGKYGIPIQTKSIKTFFDNGMDTYQGLIIPGGWQCPEILRLSSDVRYIVQTMHNNKRVIGAICHGPQVLISAISLNKAYVTGYIGIKDDLINAGVHISSLDFNVLVDPDLLLVTAQHYKDNAYFVKYFIQEVKHNVQRNQG